MNSTRITYTPRLDATPESELDVLAEIYKFVLAKQRDRPTTSGPDNDGTKVKGDSADELIIPESP